MNFILWIISKQAIFWFTDLYVNFLRRGLAIKEGSYDT